MKILINNKLVAPKDAKIPVLSEAFMFGYGVFETLRTYNNKKIFKSKEHIDRLFNSAKSLDLKIRYPKLQIMQQLEKTAKASRHALQKIKIIATKDTLIIISTPLRETPQVYKGVTCKTVKLLRPIPQAKTLSYLSSYLSHEAAVKEGFYEAILIDEKSSIYEGAYSNIFWFENETLCTRKDKVLKGITAETVMEISPFKTKFKTISLLSLLEKQEIFLTQTTKGIVPITKINNTKINNGIVGKKTARLMKLYPPLS